MSTTDIPIYVQLKRSVILSNMESKENRGMVPDFTLQNVVITSKHISHGRAPVMLQCPSFHTLEIIRP